MKRTTIFTHAEMVDWLERQYSAAELAKLADITTAGAYRILKGKVYPRPDTLRRLGLDVRYEVVK